MRHSLIENTLALLGGAGLGAGLMYLFDPDQGNRRRRDVAHAAEQAVYSTKEAMGTTLHGAGHNARSFAHRISDYAHELAGDLGERASDFTSAAAQSGRKSKHQAMKSARDYASEMADRASDMKDRLMGRAGSMASKARRSAMEESHPMATATGVTAGAVGLLAMGAGFMYFMDPARGRSRRAWARDKVFSASHRAGKRARRYGRHLGNRMKGVVAEASRAVSPGESEESSMPTAPTLRRGVAASSES